MRQLEPAVLTSHLDHLAQTMPVTLNIDRSRIPPDKLNDSRLVESENRHLLLMGYEEKRIALCLHEAAHAFYLNQLGESWEFIGPYSLYDPDTDVFHVVGAAILYIGSSHSVSVIGLARFFVAGGVIEETMTAEPPGDEQDIRDSKHVFQEVFGLSLDQITNLLKDARRDVKKDLRKKDFKRSLWILAMQFKQELETKWVRRQHENV